MIPGEHRSVFKMFFSAPAGLMTSNLSDEEAPPHMLLTINRRIKCVCVSKVADDSRCTNLDTHTHTPPLLAEESSVGKGTSEQEGNEAKD